MLAYADDKSIVSLNFNEVSAVNKVKQWFMNLSRVGKLGFISALALGTIVVGATNPSQEPTTTPGASTVEEGLPVITTEVKEETKAIPFALIQRDDKSAAKGTTFIETVGIDGVETITHTITLADGVETNRVSVSKITTQPTNQVTVAGTYVAPPAVTRSCDPNYSGCVPIVSYDLDCADIGFRVTVLGYDKHGFDGNDNDGLGCESY